MRGASLSRRRLCRSAARFAGLAGILFAARTGIVSPSIGVGLEFFAIAVVALGAGGLPSGRVKIGETLVGALILMMVFNYMTIRGIPGTWQTTATGLLLLAAMLAGRIVQGQGGAEAAVGLEAAALAESGRLARSLGRNAIDRRDAGARRRVRGRSIRALRRCRTSSPWSSRTPRSPSSRSAP